MEISWTMLPCSSIDRYRIGRIGRDRYAIILLEGTSLFQKQDAPWFWSGAG